MSRHALDKLTQDPAIRQAIHAFETRERRPIRLGPPPQVGPIRHFRVVLEYDFQPVLTLGFQNAPLVLKPGDVFRLALAQLPALSRGSVELNTLCTFLEYSQDWPARDWAQVLQQLRVPPQQAEQALTGGFTVNVGRMRE